MPPTFQTYQHHLEILRAAALRAADPAEAVCRNLKPADVADAERVFIVGAGKAGVAMAHAAVEIVGKKLAGGVLAVPHLPSSGRPPEGGRWAGGEGEPLNYIQGGHPLPTEGSLAAGRAIAELLQPTTPRDLVIALISGGGSALMELPKPGLSLPDLQIANHLLLQCGATIHEFNTVRKALSQIKGGGLLTLAAPARVLGLILSDVVGHDLAVIASGPTVFHPASESNDGLHIIRTYRLETLLPAAVLKALASPFQPFSVNLQPSPSNRLIASNRLAGEAAAHAARELGFEAEFLGDDWQGEAREVGARFAQKLLAVRRPSSAVALIAGGESTVTVRGTGKGGRNQEAALAAALALAGQPNLVISTFGTDGVDGPTEAAGATVTGETVARARARGLEPQTFLDNNDAYNFFAPLDDLVTTGPTGTNVNDLLFGLAY